MTTQDALKELANGCPDGFRGIMRHLCPDDFDLSGGNFQDKCPYAMKATDFRPPYCRDCWRAALGGDE